MDGSDGGAEQQQKSARHYIANISKYFISAAPAVAVAAAIDARSVGLSENKELCKKKIIIGRKWNKSRKESKFESNEWMIESWVNLAIKPTSSQTDKQANRQEERPFQTAADVVSTFQLIISSVRKSDACKYKLRPARSETRLYLYVFVWRLLACLLVTLTLVWLVIESFNSSQTLIHASDRGRPIRRLMSQSGSQPTS